MKEKRRCKKSRKCDAKPHSLTSNVTLQEVGVFLSGHHLWLKQIHSKPRRIAIAWGKKLVGVCSSDLSLHPIHGFCHSKWQLNIFDLIRPKGIPSDLSFLYLKGTKGIVTHPQCQGPKPRLVFPLSSWKPAPRLPRQRLPGLFVWPRVLFLCVGP